MVSSAIFFPHWKTADLQEEGGNTSFWFSQRKSFDSNSPPGFFFVFLNKSVGVGECQSEVSQKKKNFIYECIYVESMNMP